MYDIKEIYGVLQGRNYAERLFGDLGKFKKSGEGYIASCPNAANSSQHKHDIDINPSFQIYGDRPGYFCYTCGIKGDWIKYLEEFRGLSCREAIAKLSKAAGFTTQDRPHNKGDIKVGQEKIEAVYPYVDKKGEPLFHVARYEPKRFDAGIMENGKFVTKTLGDIRRVLYNLPKVIESQEVWMVEGEKDADNVNVLGLTATTVPFGKGNWRVEFAECLKNKLVNICLDVGAEKEARERAESLYSFSKEVKIVRLPGLTKTGQDISDWLETQGGLSNEQKKEGLIKIVSEARRFIPPNLVDSFSLESHSDDFMKYLEKKRSGEFWGLEIKSLPRLTQSLMGLRGILVLAAREGTGKSTLALQIALDVTDLGVGILYYDFENGVNTLIARAVCNKCEVHYYDELLNKDNAEYAEIQTKIRDFEQGYQKRLFIKNNPELSLEIMRDHISQIREKTGRNEVLVVIDSLQKLIKNKVKVLVDRRAEIDFYLRGLDKIHGEDPDVTVFLVSELARDSMKPKESGTSSIRPTIC